MFLSKSKSVYKYIVSQANRRGYLPGNFILPGGAGHMGEADSALLYQSGISEACPEKFEEFMGLLKNVYHGSKKEGYGPLAGFLSEVHVLSLIDRLCDEVYMESRGFDILRLADVAFDLATTSEDIDNVKLGISIMGMLNLEDRDDCKEVIIALGKCEEFTLYSLFAAAEWKEAAGIASDYARNLTGFGKAHADLWLEPDIV
jgi:hypothetical protein